MRKLIYSNLFFSETMNMYDIIIMGFIKDINCEI